MRRAGGNFRRPTRTTIESPITGKVILSGIVSWVLGIVVLGKKTFFPVFQWSIFSRQYPAPLRREGASAATYKKAPFRVAS